MGCTFSTKCEERIKPTCDGFRETPLRILGYATHLGNACSALIPGHLENLPCMITTAYITTDVFTKTLKSSEEGNCRAKVVIDAADAVIWQMLASVLIPGFIINKLKSLSEKATAYAPTSCGPPPPIVKAFPAPVVRALPCILGVLVVPLLIYPIDKAVNIFMDVTYRNIFKVGNPEQDKKKPTKQPTKKQNNA